MLRTLLISVFAVGAAALAPGAQIPGTPMRAVPSPNIRPDVRPPIRGEVVRSLSAERYRARDCPTIADWDWVRSRDASVAYIFDADELDGCDPSQVYINFEGLCTSGVSGGAGHDAQIKCTVRARRRRQYCRVRAENPFRPRTDKNSRGVGYQVYGHSDSLDRRLVEEAMDIGRLEVRFEWGDIEARRHVAVKRDSVRLGYVQEERRWRGRHRMESNREERFRFDDEGPALEK